MNIAALLFALQARPRRSAWVPGELESMLVHLAVGCVVAVGVFRLLPRVPWPRPMTWRFVAFHIMAAPASALVWLLVSAMLEPLVGGRSDVELSRRLKEMVVVGSFIYVVVAGLSYSADGAARAAKAEAVAARTQMATLRSQLQPHFLFNALHTVVQLIHIEPRRAVEAAELVAELLRRTLEEQRDEVPLSDEWRFVSRYLAIEQMRFGDRLVVNAELPAALQSERVPAFALQTLVENAVQHGAAPRVAPTEITITANASSSALVIAVRNSGDPDPTPSRGKGTGTGLARLRERLAVLYGGTAVLVAGPMATGGYEAVLTVPRKDS